ncbi:MAG: hypothetical protein HZB91_12740 [Elusimicrobia bacterium]|nr:hypothetical protein [Elusimicrobiota bacterium]
MSSGRSLPLFLLFLCLPGSVQAWYLESNASHTLGPDNYNSSSGYIEAGQDEGFSIRPGFSTQHSLDSDPTRTVSLRLGWSSENLALGCDGSSTPPANDYKSHSLGCDAAYSLHFGSRSGDDKTESRSSGGLSRIDIGGSFLYTDHKETWERVIRVRRRVIGTETIILDAGQYDMTGTLGARIFDLETSGEITFSKYDRHIPTDETPAMAVAVTRGANPAVYGFQDWVGRARLSWSRFAVFQPFMEWSYTKYKMVSQYPQKTYTAGLSTTLGPITVKGSWDLYVRGSGDKRSYYTSAATYRF